MKWNVGCNSQPGTSDKAPFSPSWEDGAFCRFCEAKSAYAAAKRVKMPNGETLYDQLRR